MKWTALKSREKKGPKKPQVLKILWNFFLIRFFLNFLKKKRKKWPSASFKRSSRPVSRSVSRVAGRSFKPLRFLSLSSQSSLLLLLLLLLLLRFFSSYRVLPCCIQLLFFLGGWGGGLVEWFDLVLTWVLVSRFSIVPSFTGFSWIVFRLYLVLPSC